MEREIKSERKKERKKKRERGRGREDGLVKGTFGLILAYKAAKVIAGFTNRIQREKHREREREREGQWKGRDSLTKRENSKERAKRGNCSLLFCSERGRTVLALTLLVRAVVALVLLIAQSLSLFLFLGLWQPGKTGAKHAASTVIHVVSLSFSLSLSLSLNVR